ncbi:MAG: GlsB/YeaQ/YmgE family stress response membrane protein [Thermovirgaceae bacterium]
MPGTGVSGSMNDLVGYLVVGIIAGWLAGKVWQGRGFGFFGNLGVGVIGAFIGGVIFSSIGIYPMGFLGSLVMAFAGAVVLLFVVGLLKGK